jgi:hypothetical protein
MVWWIWDIRNIIEFIMETMSLAQTKAILTALSPFDLLQRDDS